MSDKKVVHYKAGTLTFIALGVGATLIPIDHPDKERVTNTKEVWTSPVVAYDKATGFLETQNTLYYPEV